VSLVGAEGAVGEAAVLHDARQGEQAAPAPFPQLVGVGVEGGEDRGGLLGGDAAGEDGAGGVGPLDSGDALAASVHVDGGALLDLFQDRGVVPAEVEGLNQGAGTIKLVDIVELGEPGLDFFHV
jgi:hypothetical protein